MPAEIIIAGDLCLQDRTAKMPLQALIDSHQQVISITSAADYSIVNLECAVSDNRSLKPIKKAGIALRNGSTVLDFLKSLGFDAVTLANNHFADFGNKGVNDSLESLALKKIDFVGAGRDINQAQRVLYKQGKWGNLAIINACEHEFTIATDKKAGCNPLNPIAISYKIQEARKIADYVLVIIHGGHEHFQLPTLRMKQMYRFFVDMGADVVVNHHQHCYSGFEIYNGKPILYGLGNFSFYEHGLRNSSWNEGVLLRLNLDEEIGFELIPFVQNNEEVGVKLMVGGEKELFRENITQLNSVIGDDELLKNEFEELCRQRYDEYMHPLMPYQNQWLLRLARHHLIPSKWAKKLLPAYMTTERKLFLKSFFQCESHQEIMNKLLEQ